MEKPNGFWWIYGPLGLAWIAAFAVVLWGQTASALNSSAEETVRVNRGESLGMAIARMTEEGKLAHPQGFRLLAVMRGDSGRIKAGEFVVSPGLSPGGLLNLMVSGESRRFRLTIPEGFNLRDVADKVEAEHKGNGKRFLALCQNSAFIATLGLPSWAKAPTLEGFLYPDTYLFAYATTEEEMIAFMVERFKEKAVEVLEEGAPEAGLTPYQALVLASIVEKETGLASERPMISGVFHNRLKIHMPLATDPAVIYGVPNFDGNLTRRHLTTPGPYNTYINQGLTPTPITNPGLDAIQAAMKPARVEYLFFVAKGDGSHYFSKDFKTHSAAVRKYQIRPHRKQGN
ncbi:MAG: endolytic transglycosylase MltG [Deltaproteobacteria bacterium]|nr:endolytic transglycosylase MltG [Deltaproteobacteria bacterium]